MDYNYHTHTARCGHAVGEDEEYVKRAIECGIKYMGFSDHAPFMFPDGFQSSHRVQLDRVQDYYDSITALRDKYKDKIDLKIGFEMEYYPAYFEDMLKIAREAGAEYLILGQHCIYNEHPNGAFCFVDDDNVDHLKEFVSCIVTAIKSGVFTYVAHPDMFSFKGDDEIYREEMQKICIASKEYGVPLEINLLGIRDNRHYPYEPFWEMAGEIGCPVTFGCDAHSPQKAYDGESLSRAKEIVEKYSLNYIGKPKIINIQ